MYLVFLCFYKNEINITNIKKARTNNHLTPCQLESSNSLMYFSPLLAAISTFLFGITLYSFQ